MSGAAVISNSMMPNSEMVSILTAEFLMPAQVASMLKVSRWTLADWRLKRQGPPFMLRGRGVVVYPRRLFEVYLRQRQNPAHPAIPNVRRVRQAHIGG